MCIIISTILSESIFYKYVMNLRVLKVECHRSSIELIHILCRFRSEIARSLHPQGVRLGRSAMHTKNLNLYKFKQQVIELHGLFVRGVSSNSGCGFQHIVGFENKVNRQIFPNTDSLID